MMMTRLLFLLLLFTPTLAQAQVSGFVVWGSDEDFNGDNGTPDLLDDSGFAIPNTSDWLLLLFRSTDDIMDPFVPGSDDTLVTTADGTDILSMSLATDELTTDGTFSVTLYGGSDYPGALGSMIGDKVFTVMINAAAIEDATLWAIVDDALFTVPTGASGEGLINIGELAAADWQDASCAAGEFWGPRGCELCDSSCGACDGPSANECTICAVGSALVSGACLPLGEGCMGRDDSQCTTCVANAQPNGLDCICATGFFDNDAGAGFGAMTCEACQACASDEYLTAACTTTSNTVCDSCTVCAVDTFASTACAGSSDTTCSACSSCDAGSFASSVCTATADTICTTCATCGAGTFESSACTATSDTACSACSTCADGFFQSAACTASTDTVCTACSACAAGEVATGGCTGTQDTVCEPAQDISEQPSNNDDDGGCQQVPTGPAFMALLALLGLRRRFAQ